MLNIYFENTDKFSYDGTQLRSHFILEKFGLRCDAMVAWVGGCLVETKELVDQEDRLQGDRIVSESMVHFIAEFFELNLKETVFFQRLMVARLAEILRVSAPKTVENIRVSGDDIFIGDAKLTVSIATRSPVSCLIHFGVNIDATGAPVKAIGLTDVGIKSLNWVPEFLEAMQQELATIQWACAKVRPVV